MECTPEGFPEELATPYITEQFKLRDIQERHHRQLQSSGLLGKAILQARHDEVHRQPARILPEHLIVQSFVYLARDRSSIPYGTGIGLRAAYIEHDTIAQEVLYVPVSTFWEGNMREHAPFGPEDGLRVSTLLGEINDADLQGINGWLTDIIEPAA